MSSANSASRTIGKAIAWMAAIEDLRKDDEASPNKIKRNDANGQPCRTDLEIGNNVPLPPENRTELEACLYNADTPFIHALGNPNLNRTDRIRFGLLHSATTKQSVYAQKTENQQ